MIGKWERLLLETAGALRFIAQKLVRTVELADDPEKVLASQLTSEQMQKVREVAAERLSPLIAAAVQDPERNYGRFVLLELLRTLPHGNLHRGWDKKTGETCQVLIIPKTKKLDLEKILHEAQAASRVRHPAIQTIRTIDPGDDGLILSLQEPPGEPIAARKRAIGFLLPAMRDLAIALNHAHDQGILHLDITPDNVYVSEDGDPMLVGLGLSKILSLGGTEAGRKGMIGTPAYMAPEQAKRKNAALDRRTDVYGFGATLYALLAGRPPYMVPRVSSVIKAAAVGDLVRLRGVAPEVASELENIVMKCMAKEPDDRYSGLFEVASDLSLQQESRPVAASSVTIRIKVKRRRRAWHTVLALLLLAAVGGGAYGIYTLIPRPVETAPDIGALLKKARTGFMAGRLAESRSASEEALKIDPQSPEAKLWLLRGELRPQLIDRRIPRPYLLEGALQWREAPRATVRAGVLVDIKGLSSRLTGQERVALEALVPVLENDIERAIPLLETALEQNRDDLEIRLALASGLYRTGDFNGARSVAAALLKGPLEPQARSIIALSWLGSGLHLAAADRSEAQDHFSQGLKTAGKLDHPQGASAVASLHGARAQLLRSHGQERGARGEYAEALQALSKHEADWIRLQKVRVLLSMAESEFASAGSRSALDRITDAQRELTGVRSQVGGDSEYLRLDADALFLRARARRWSNSGAALRDLGRARSRLQEAIALKRDPELLLKLIEIDRLHSAIEGTPIEFAAELERIDGILSDRPNWIPGLVARGRLHAFHGARTGARSLADASVRDFEEVLRRSPSNVTGACELASALRLRARLSPDGSLEDLVKALKTLNRIVKEHPRFIQALQARADVFAQFAHLRQRDGSDDPDRVARIMNLINADTERILEADPDQIGPRMHHARSLLALGREAQAAGENPRRFLTVAIQECNAVIGADRRDVEALRLRALAYLIRARFDLQAPDADASLRQAVQDLERANAYHPDDVDLLLLRAEAHLHRGILNQAFDKTGGGEFEAVRPHLDRAFELRPDSPLAFRLRGTLSLHQGFLPEALRDLEEAVRRDPSIRGQLAPLIEKCRIAPRD